MRSPLRDGRGATVAWRALAVALACAGWVGLAAAPQPLASHDGSGAVLASGPAPASAPSKESPQRPHTAVVARVNGVTIDSDRLAAAVNVLLPMESFHRNVSAERLETLRREALERLIDDELAYQEGRRLRLVVARSRIDKAVAATAARYGGVRALGDALARSGGSMGEVRREVERSLVIGRAIDAAVMSRCRVTGNEAASYFGQNPEKFLEPEQLHVYVITFGVDPSSPTRAWTEAKHRADDIRRQLVTGAPFETMAQAYSTDASRTSGGDMGFVHRGSLSEPFEQIARDLSVGQVSEVIETIHGYHIMRITDVRPPRRARFTDVAQKLQAELTEARCAERRAVWFSSLRAQASVVLGP